MSTALQSTPHQSSALTSPALASSSALPYASPHAASSREAYHAQLSTTSSPSSRRPPSRKASGGAPTGSSDAINSAQAVSQGQSSHNRSSNMPPVAPPRTSSSQQGGSARRSNYSSEKMTAPRGASRGDVNGNSEAHRSKRTTSAHDSPRQNSSRDGRANDANLPIRAPKDSAGVPGSSHRSAYDASDLAADAASVTHSDNRSVPREYQGSPMPDDDAAPPPVVQTGEERRGGRSRHDHSRTQKGTTKFGDFILGNTIGEGEFGKVKLGWKQDSNVQVRIVQQL
jgi:protein-serine/threonine kinase